MGDGGQLQPHDLHPPGPAIAHRRRRGHPRPDAVVWNPAFLGQAVLAIAAFGAISLSLALLALRGRVRRA